MWNANTLPSRVDPRPGCTEAVCCEIGICLKSASGTLDMAVMWWHPPHLGGRGADGQVISPEVCAPWGGRAERSCGVWIKFRQCPWKAGVELRSCLAMLKVLGSAWTQPPSSVGPAPRCPRHSLLPGLAGGRRGGWALLSFCEKCKSWKLVNFSWSKHTFRSGF